MYDNINAIFFLENKNLVNQVNLSRKFGDFRFSKNPIPKDKAIFTLKK